jgi:hypothetical protein
VGYCDPGEAQKTRGKLESEHEYGCKIRRHLEL